MKRRLLCLMIAAATLITIPSVSAEAATIKDVSQYIKVTSYDPNVDYTREMDKCLTDGSPYAIAMGKIYEQQRNLKIDGLGWGKKYQKTYYFQNATTAEQVRAAMEEAKKPKYTEEDLDWLARCVNAEMGCDWMPDWVQRDTASVVINNSKLLGKTIKQTIMTPYKYGCYWTGAIWKTPTAKVKANCKWVLENGVTLPSYVIGQSGPGDVYGPVYKTYYDPILGTTTYFWYTTR